MKDMDSCSHNNEINYAIEYHERTKHSELSLRMSRHYLDFDNKPRPFKVYLDLPSISLPADFAVLMENALICIRGKYSIGKPRQQPLQTIDVRILAQLLFFSAGITREMKFDSGIYYMRAASATGALYPIELYVICQDIAGLPAGIYHFCPGDFSLTELRSGDYTAKLAAMSGYNHDILTSPVTIAFTSLAWRNTWKYTARSYRHWFWDSGVIAANLLAVGISAGLRPSLVMGFVDSAVNSLLLLEQRKEAAIVLAPIISRSSTFAKITADDDHHLQPDSNLAVQAIDIPRILAISKGKATEYPEIWKLQEMSSSISNQEVREWILSGRANDNFYLERGINNSEPQVKEEDLSSKDMPKNEQFLQQDVILQSSIGNVILRRGSSRQFSHSAISLDQLNTILYSSTRCIKFDFREKRGSSLIDIYLIANSVQGLASGHYFYDRDANCSR